MRRNTDFVPLAIVEVSVVPMVFEGNGSEPSTGKPFPHRR